MFFKSCQGKDREESRTFQIHPVLLLLRSPNLTSRCSEQVRTSSIGVTNWTIYKTWNFTKSNWYIIKYYIHFLWLIIRDVKQTCMNVQCHMTCISSMSTKYGCEYQLRVSERIFLISHITYAIVCAYVAAACSSQKEDYNEEKIDPSQCCRTPCIQVLSLPDGQDLVLTLANLETLIWLHIIIPHRDAPPQAFFLEYWP